MELDGGDLVKIIAGVLSRKHVVDALFASSATILFYDWFLVLPREVKHIWGSSWNWTKALYFLTRYIPFINVALILRNQFASNATPESCRNATEAICWLSVAGIDFAEVVLIVRTYAVWNKNKRVGIALALLLALCQIPSAITEAKFIQSVKFIHNPYPEIYQGCVIIGAARLVFVNWMVVIMLEGVVLGLMITNAWKTHGYTSNLLNAIYVDSIRFYLCVFCVTLVNILITLLLPVDFIGVGSSIEIVLHSNLTCRLMIGLREASQSYKSKAGTFEPPGTLNTAIEFTHMNRRGNLVESPLTDPEAHAGPSRRPWDQPQ